jgi:hypothetical protein
VCVLFVDGSQEVQTRLNFILRNGGLDDSADDRNVNVIRAYFVCRGHHRNVDIYIPP